MVAEATASDLHEWELLEDEQPLALQVMWHRDGQVEEGDFWAELELDQPGRLLTSQRLAIQGFAKSRVIHVTGGNRSSKTHGVKCAIMALGIGSDHPAAAAFWEVNGVDASEFPTGPCNADHNDGEVWIIAVSSAASKEYHRSAIEELLPAGSYKWRNRDGQGPAELEVTCPGYDYPAIFRFKSEDQGWKKMQGARCRAVWHDEEGDTRDVFVECGTRLTDLNGWHVLSNTPLEGFTWVHDDLVDKVGDYAVEDAVTYNLVTFDNPYLSKAGVRRLARGNRALKAAKLLGLATSREGRIYPEFDRNVHAIAPYDIEAAEEESGGKWPRHRVVDFGTRNPFWCGWFVTEPSGRDVLYREHHQAEWTLKRHVAHMREAEGWVPDPDGDGWVIPEGGSVEQFEMSWADPEDAQQLKSLVVDHDLEFVKAKKAVSAGLDAVSERFDPTQPGGPSLVFFNTCTHAIREHLGYVWAKATKKGEKPDKPKKKDDHSCDGVRYYCMGVKGSTIATSGGE